MNNNTTPSSNLVADSLPSEKCSHFETLTLPFVGTAPLPDLSPSHFTVSAGGHFLSHPAHQGRALVWRAQPDLRSLELVEHLVAAPSCSSSSSSISFSSPPLSGLRICLADDEISPPLLLAEAPDRLRLVLLTRRRALHLLDLPLSHSPGKPLLARLLPASSLDLPLRHQHFSHALLSSPSPSLLLGCEAGILAVLPLASPRAPPVVLNQRSIIGKLFGWRDNPYPSRVVSVVPLPRHLVAVLSADGFLSLWDLRAAARLLHVQLASDQLQPQTLRVALQHGDSERGLDGDADGDDLEEAQRLSECALLVYFRSSDGRQHSFVAFQLEADDDADGFTLEQRVVVQAPRPLVGAASTQYLLDYGHTADGFLWTLWMSERCDGVGLYRIPLLPFVRQTCALSASWMPTLTMPSPLPSLPFPPNASLDPHLDASRILMSPAFSLPTLRDALQLVVDRIDPGFQPEFGFSQATRNQLRGAFVSFCEHNSPPDASHQQRLQLWQQIIASCHEIWLRENLPVALLASHPRAAAATQTAMMLIKQSGLSVIRATFQEEAWAYFLRTADTLSPLEIPSEIQVVLSVLSQISAHLTVDTHDLFLDISADPLSMCYPVITALITGTFPASDVNQAIELESFPLPSAFSKSSFVSELIQSLFPLITSGSLLGVLTAMLRTLSQLQPLYTEGDDANTRPFQIHPSILLSTTLWLTETRFELLRDILLLLCLVSHLRSVLPFSPADLNTLQCKALPYCTTLFKSFRLMRWLFHRSSVQILASDERANFHIFDRPKIAQVQINLLESFISSDLPPITHLPSAVYRLLRTLYLGDPSVFVEICDQLRQRRDFVTLEQMLRHPPLDFPALDYLRGISHLDRGQIEKAHFALSKVAVYFSSLQSSPAQPNDAISLQYLTRSSDRILVEAHDFSEELDQFSPQIRFFLSVLVLYSQQKIPAFYFHEIALQIIQVAEDPRLKETIWIRTFRRWLEAGNFQAAYEIVLEFFNLAEFPPNTADPTPSSSSSQTQLGCLRLLVISMCEQGQISEFMSLPLFGPLVDRVDSILQTKAENSDIKLRPNYYEILYSFRTLRADFRKAGLAMWRLADRLLTESAGREALEQHTNALAAATASWSLINNDQHFVVSRPITNPNAPSTVASIEPSFGHPLNPEFPLHESLLSDYDEDDDGFVDGIDHHNEHEIDELIQKLEDISPSPDVQIFTGPQFEKQYLLGYILNLIASHGKFSSHDIRSLQPADILAPLLKMGYLNLSLSLCKRFSLSMSPLFSILAQEWLRLLPRDPLSPLPPPSIDPHASIDLLAIRGYEGRPELSTFERLIHELLLTYDTKETNYEYMKVVAQAILLSHSELPTWLFDLFMQRQQFDVLLDIFYDFSLVSQSIDCLSQLLTPIIIDSTPTIFPRTQINRLLEFLHKNNQHSEVSKIQQLVEKIH